MKNFSLSLLSFLLYTLAASEPALTQPRYTLALHTKNNDLRNIKKVVHLSSTNPTPEQDIPVKSIEDAIMIASQIQEHLLHYFPRHSFFDKLLWRKKYEEHKTVIDQLQQSAAKLFMIFNTPTTYVTAAKNSFEQSLPTEKILSVTISLHALRLLSQNTKEQTYAEITGVTGKKFKPKTNLLSIQ